MQRGLTTFRFLAFFLVFLAHSNWDRFGSGFIGVQAFFVLSGFLLIPILADMKQEMPRRDYFFSFYGRRALRIFPLYYGYLIGFLAVSLLLVNANHNQLNRFLEQAPWAFTYSYDFFHASIFFKTSRILTHFWSLAIEEQFYLIFPILVLLVKPRHFRAFLLATICIGPLLRFLIAITVKFGFLPFIGQRTDLVIYVLPFSHFDAFAIGGYFALYQKNAKSNWWLFLLIVFSILLGYLTQYLSSGKIVLLSLGYLPFMDHQYIWGYSLINCVFAFMLIQIRDDKLFPKFFNNAVFHYLGTISYGLYVFHFPMLWLIQQIFPTMAWSPRILLSFLSTILISATSYELFEKSFINMKDKFFPKTRTKLFTERTPISKETAPVNESP